MTKKDGYIVAASLLIVTIGSYIFYKKVIKKETKTMAETPTESKKVKSILFIGDSNTEAPFSYADKIKKQYPDLNIKKIAKHSMKTDWMYNQLENELKNNKYDVVSILGGSNDIYATGKNDGAKTYLQKMYDLAKSNGSKVVAVTPPNKDFYVNRTEGKQNALRDLNNWISANKSVDQFIDFHKMTANQNLFSKSDGYLHPQSAAHDLLKLSFTQKIL